MRVRKMLAALIGKRKLRMYSLIGPWEPLSEMGQGSLYCEFLRLRSLDLVELWSLVWGVSCPIAVQRVPDKGSKHNEIYCYDN